jgi:uncharacterized protein (DUF2236 family)
LVSIDQKVNCWNAETMTVTRAELEEHLERIRARVVEPRAGLFGPRSLVWKVNREQMMFLAAGRAALLQEAHPFVAHGVDQHSLTRADPQGRFKRTFKHVYAMVYGDLDSALIAARRVHAIHERIRGTMNAETGSFAPGSAYAANTEHALLWVHATLWESSMLVYERIFRALSRADKDQYYQETKLFAYLFGISDAVLPPTWQDFQAYNQRMWDSNELVVGDIAREMARFLFTAATPRGQRVMSWYATVTAGLLPARLRKAYGLAFGPRERALFEASLTALRAAVRVMPRRYRYVHAYHRARLRMGDPIVPTMAERVLEKTMARRFSRAAPSTVQRAR